MKRIPLHIEISEENPAYLWAKKQSDSVNAMGHIGTHLDCYTKVPVYNAYKLDVAVFDCRDLMPEARILISTLFRARPFFYLRTP